jgi:peroxisomal coenzyme A diphosphatase NUDT7
VFEKKKYREAFEEVGLPLNCPDVHTIGLLDPFVSSSKIFVTPVVAVLTNLAILNHLKAAKSEVAKIFEHPLRAILDPNLIQGEILVPEGSEDWPFQTRFYVRANTK